MAEYIKREAARELIKNYGKGAIADGVKALDPVDDIIVLAKGVDLIPAADMVEVVRCKECKHLEKDEGLLEGRMCLVRGSAGWCHDNDFCSYGERKDSPTNEA